MKTRQDIADDRALRAYVVERAGELYAAGDQDAAVALLRQDHLARWRADLRADRMAAAPSRGDRVAGAVLGAGKGAFPPFMCSLAAGALVGPHVAAAIGTLTLAMAAVGAVIGFCTGGRT